MNTIKQFCILGFFSLSGLLSACVSSTGTTSMGTVPPTELVSIQQRLQDNSAKVQRLQDSLVMLEVRLLDQQRLVEELRQQVTGGEIKSGVQTSSGAEDSKKSSTEIYRAAFGNYASGHYQKSIQGFSNFLIRFPSNDYAANARFWLAESYFAQGDYNQAAVEFERIYNDFPLGDKTAEALLKLAAAQHQLNQPENVQRTIELLKEKYPKSAAARKAEQAYQ